MPFVAITGSYCTGKSTVLKIFKQFGATVYDIDNQARDLYKKGSILYRRLVNHFGKRILDRRGDINRKALSDIVFSSGEKVEELNALTHPEIIKAMKSLLRKQHRKDVVVIEVPLLFENNLQEMFDYSVLVTSLRSSAAHRAGKGRNISGDDFKRRVSFQMPQSRKKKLADFVINNSGSKKELKRKVKKLWEKIVRRPK